MSSNLDTLACGAEESNCESKMPSSERDRVEEEMTEADTSRSGYNKVRRRELEDSIQMTIHNTINNLSQTKRKDFLTETIRNTLHNKTPAEMIQLEPKSSLFSNELVESSKSPRTEEIVNGSLVLNNKEK